MADDPSLALQGAISTALKADAALSALIGTRVRDRVEEAIAFPYVTVGDDVVSVSLADCYVGSDFLLTLHAWSRAVGFVEVKQIAAAVRDCLHEAELAVAGFHLVDLLFDGTRFLRDPDGLTTHAVITFRAMLEPAD